MTATERQKVTRDLEAAYWVQVFAEANALESSDSSSDSGADSESDAESDADLVSTSILTAIQLLHSQRYINERRPIIKDSSQLRLTLTEWIDSQPQIFRRHLRVNPDTFYALCRAIGDDPIFKNNSQNEQIPVDQQIAVALYRFGHFGNGTNMSDVGLWAGFGHGTVDRITRRVIVAATRATFRKAAVRWVTDEEREAAKDWVAEAAVPGWRNGWLMVDGSLIPLAARPGHFGSAWFDRKCNYSLNLQVRVLIF